MHFAQVQGERRAHTHRSVGHSGRATGNYDNNNNNNNDCEFYAMKVDCNCDIVFVAKVNWLLLTFIIKKICGKKKHYTFSWTKSESGTNYI